MWIFYQYIYVLSNWDEETWNASPFESERRKQPMQGAWKGQVWIHEMGSIDVVH